MDNLATTIFHAYAVVNKITPTKCSKSAQIIQNVGKKSQIHGFKNMLISSPCGISACVYTWMIPYSGSVPMRTYLPPLWGVS